MNQAVVQAWSSLAPSALGFSVLCYCNADFSHAASASGHPTSAVVQNVPNRADFEVRLANLEKRLARFEALPTQGSWLDQQRAHEIRELIQAVISDADARASLREDRATAGYKNDFFLGSPDGSFLLEFSGQLQLRYMFSHQQSSPTDDDVGGFDVRRLQLKAGGHIVTPRLQYSISVQAGASTSTPQLLDAWSSYELTEGLEVKLGRFRPPFLKEHDISSKRQLLVDRSLIARAFGLNRDLGLLLDFEGDGIRAEAAVVDADRELSSDRNWIASARAEALILGKWKRLNDLTSWPDDDEPTIAVGSGIRLREKDRHNPDKADSQTLGWTIDVSAEGAGKSISAAVIGNHRDKEGGPTLNQYGLVLQAGWFVGRDWELVARYEYGEADGIGEELSIATAGINHYIAKHDIKWTTDVGYGLNPVSDFWSSETLGWRTDSDGEEGQIIVRSQFQILF